MSYVAKSLLPDEKLIYAATLHWIIFVPGLVITFVGGVLSAMAPQALAQFTAGKFAPEIHQVSGVIGGAIVLCGLVILLGAFIRQNTTELAVTNQRIIAKYGFISRTTYEIMINRISGSNFEQTIMGRILGYGTVLVHGAGGDISPFDVVSDPQAFHRALTTVLEHMSLNAAQPIVIPVAKTK